MELYTGRTQTIYLDIYVNDELVEVTALPSVSIYDNKTDLLIVSGLAKKELNDEGHYSFEIRDDYLQIDRDIKAVWSYSYLGNTMSSIDTYSVVTPYLSISDTYTKLHLGREEGDQNYMPLYEVQQAEKFARFMIENYTGMSFGKHDKTITAYGQDADVLFLGEKVISISSLKENGNLVIDNNTSTNNFGYPIQVTETGFSIRIVSTDDINEGGKMDIVYPMKGTFYNGYRYELNGIFGWKFVPEKVQTAALMLMKDYFGKDNIWRARYVNSVSFGDTDMQFSKLAFRGTGNFYVDKLLDEYKSTNMAVI
jgi:hypothetical protein